MNRIDKFLQIILSNEGGAKYTNIPSDSGGETKFGIADMADGVRDGMTDTDFDGKPDTKIKDLTLEQAVRKYRKIYYDPVKADMIRDELLALHVFDFAVNAGVGRSVKTLQQIVGVTQDGLLGAKTLEKVNTGGWTQKFIDARIAYYKKIGTGKNAKFLNGWLNRVRNTSKAI